MMVCFCFAFLDLLAQPKKKDPEIFVPVTKALQPSFEGPPMAPANMEPRVAESTGCQATPSRFTLQNERFARPYHLLIMGPSGLELFEDPAPCSEVLLDEIDYMKSSHLSYDCTMSHSCLLGFLCQNLFQGAILGSLKEWLFWISIQRVTLTTMLSNCFVNLSVNPLSVFLTTRPILPQPAHLSYLPFPEWGFLFLSLLHRQQEPWKHPKWKGTVPNQLSGWTCNNNTHSKIMRPHGSCTRGPSQTIQWSQCDKSTHFITCPWCCASVLHFSLHERSHNQRDDPEIFVPVTKALQPSFEGLPMAPANMETRVAESTGCQATPSRLTRLNERFARHYHLLITGWNFLRTPHLVLKYFWMRLTTWNPHTFPMTAQCHIPAFWDFSARIFSKEPSSAAWSNVRSAEASNVSHLQLG